MAFCRESCGLGSDAVANATPLGASKKREERDRRDCLVDPPAAVAGRWRGDRDGGGRLRIMACIQDGCEDHKGCYGTREHVFFSSFECTAHLVIRARRKNTQHQKNVDVSAQVICTWLTLGLRCSASGRHRSRKMLGRWAWARKARNAQ